MKSSYFAPSFCLHYMFPASSGRISSLLAPTGPVLENVHRLNLTPKRVNSICVSILRTSVQGRRIGKHIPLNLT